MIITDEVYLMHYGILRKSGRYPWGSGGTQSARDRTFLETIGELRKQGMSDTDIARGFDMTTTQLRAVNSIAKNRQRQEKINQAQKLRDKGYSNIKIGERMGIPESSVRALLAPGAKDRADNLESIANMLRTRVDQDRYIDIGKGNENEIGISKEKLKTAVAMLREEGYKVQYLKIPQLGTGLDTSRIVLTKPEVTGKELWANRDQVKLINNHSDDGGRTFDGGFQPPLSIASKRIAIRYKEDGGAEADGVMYIRPGVKDVSIGNNRYAQVRVAVDGTHYLKGMALYKEDLPPGVDILFNTNKSNTGNKLDALKPMKLTDDGKPDPDNPFGANIKRQIIEEDSHGVKKVTSAMNLVNEEGNWNKWSRHISSQVLSKQSPKLVKEQLDMTFERKKNEFDNIMALTNPTVKAKLLESFADGADSSAVHLKAAALPRASYHVILPINSMKETEVYAPRFNNGEKVALIRYPHAGTFEIPELTVNNRQAEAKSIIGNAAKDAIGIHSKVAEHLSGADFDGDFVLVVPNNSGKIKTTSPLEGLKHFDPRSEYPPYDGMKTMDGGIYHAATKSVEYTKAPSSRLKGIEMGKVSNLITDMTLKGASTQELAQAVRHSMVVIDAEKHHLDWQASARANGIPALMKKYQRGSQGGASTLISRKGSTIDVPQRKQGYRIDPITGQKVFRETGDSYIDRSGKLVVRTTKAKQILEVKDVNSLASGTPIEKLYADHANRLKALANQARLEQINTTPRPVSASAKHVYEPEVKRLNAALNVALKNAPLERQAQAIANARVAAKKAASPDLDKATLKKIEGQELANARTRMGSGKAKIEISEREWEAIQAGAVSNHRLKQILDNADMDQVKKLATPRAALLMDTSKTVRAQQMIASGYTRAEIASHLGVSLSTLEAAIGGDGSG